MQYTSATLPLEQDRARFRVSVRGAPLLTLVVGLAVGSVHPLSAQTDRAGSGGTPGSPASPRQLLGSLVEHQEEIADPHAAAVRGFRRVHTDAYPSPGTSRDYSLSPDGAWLAHSFEYYDSIPTTGPSGVWLHQPGKDHTTKFAVQKWEARRVSSSGATAYCYHYSAPTWSPDGTEVWFESYLGFLRGPRPGREHFPAIWSACPDGTRPRRRTPAGVWAEDPELSPGKHSLAFLSRSGPGERDGALRVLTLSTGRLRTLVRSGVRTRARWSSDGKWLAYADHRSLYRVAPSGGQSRLLATASDPGRGFPRDLVWLSDHNLLFNFYLFRTDPGAPHRSEVWRAGLRGAPTRLGEGEVLAGTRDGRILLMRLGQQCWRVVMRRTPRSGAQPTHPTGSRTAFVRRLRECLYSDTGRPSQRVPR